jgi:uroporphyrinogen decarboxylase
MFVKIRFCRISLKQKGMDIFMSEQMTAKERMKTALTGGIPDRVPAAPDFSVMIPCKLTGMPWWDVLRYGKVPLWRAYLNAVDRFGTDAWFIYGAPGYKSSNSSHLSCEQKDEFVDGHLVTYTKISTPDGDLFSKTCYFENDADTTPEKMVKDFKQDFKKLLHLFPVYDDCDYALMREQQKVLGDRGLFGVDIYPPGFHTLFSYFNGNLESCVYAYYDEPDLFAELVDRFNRHVLSKTRLAIEGGCESILTGGSGSITLQSPELWREMSLPTLKKITKMCKEAGVISGIHSCGKETYLVKTCAEETDLNYVNPLEIPPMGDVNLAEIKEKYGRKVALMGNLHTTETMLYGDVNTVRRESLKAILDAGQNGGFVLSTGDQCPRDTSDDNILEMVRVCKKFGTYPLDIDRIKAEIACIS